MPLNRFIGGTERPTQTAAAIGIHFLQQNKTDRVIIPNGLARTGKG